MPVKLKIFVGGYRLDPSMEKVREQVYRAIEDFYPHFDPYMLTELHGKRGGLREQRALEQIRDCDLYVIVLFSENTTWEGIELKVALDYRKPILILAIDCDKDFLQRCLNISKLVNVEEVTIESAPEKAKIAVKRLSENILLEAFDTKRRSFTGIPIRRIQLDISSTEWSGLGLYNWIMNSTVLKQGLEILQ